jgi:hypothetical protein
MARIYGLESENVAKKCAVLCFAKTLIRTGNLAIRWRDSLKGRLGWDPQGRKFSPAGNARRSCAYIHI